MYKHSLVIQKLSYYPGEIKEDRKSGNISWEIRIAIMRHCRVEYWCPTLFKIGRICKHFIPHSKFCNESMNL